jgi:hypothetical protein
LGGFGFFEVCWVAAMKRDRAHYRQPKSHHTPPTIFNNRDSHNVSLLTADKAY